MAKVYSPNKDYNGVSASVTFVKGVGETSNPNLIEWFKNHGYKVVEEKQPEDDSKGAEPQGSDNAPDENQDQEPKGTDSEENQDQEPEENTGKKAKGGK